MITIVLELHTLNDDIRGTAVNILRKLLRPGGVDLATIVCVAIVLTVAAGGVGWSEEDAAGDRIVIRLVNEDGVPVDELEELEPVARTVFDESGARTENLGVRAVLWVRNANVSDRFQFEQFHEGKYIRRSASLRIDPQELGTGEHFINPGHHRFVLGEDGTLTSEDPAISITGKTLDLTLQRVDILAVNGALSGPPETRLVPANLGLVQAGADDDFRSGTLPDNPRSLTNLLSHSRTFYGLSVYLPSNVDDAPYVMYPSWQAFHVTGDGEVVFDENSDRVAGIVADTGRITIPYRTFEGRVNSKTGLRAAVGTTKLSEEMRFGPTLEKVRFRAGLGEPDEDFALDVDTDFSNMPYKFFLADNTTTDPKAVRMMILEWDHPVFTAGSEVEMGLRFQDTPGKPTVDNPVARMAYSRYDPDTPDDQVWIDMGIVSWEEGKLQFKVPRLDYEFYVFRVSLHDSESEKSVSELRAEVNAAVVRPGQIGTASFITNKNRDAFVCGEDVRVTAVTRSEKTRPAGTRRIVLHHPDGYTEDIEFKDSGRTWHAEPFRLKSEVTRNLAPGTYKLEMQGLPDGMASVPFEFDMVGASPRSLYKIVKPSKYTGPMNSLVTSHLKARGADTAVDLDRAVGTLAKMGYNRIDLMTYITNHHVRPHAWRENLAAVDSRLMSPETVYTPSPRDQLLNASVRYQIEFSDVFLSYNDFHLPRYIDGYINASKRWITREMLSMRHSPALEGMMLYDEMYTSAVTGIVEAHQKLFPALRERKVSEKLGIHPSRIESDMVRYATRPETQRDPESFQNYLAYRQWQIEGWGDYNTRVANAAREVVPDAKMGTYHRTFMSPGKAAASLVNGYPPDVFEGLDLLSHVHYADNSTGWVHSSIMVDGLRSGDRRPVFINIPLSQERRNRWNGEYQRHMAFAMLSEGADGISQWGLPHSFNTGPNPGTVAGREVTEQLNKHVLEPFGEIVSRTEDGYDGVGIVATLNQLASSEYKRIGTSHMAEELWVACWRLGYSPDFLREEAFEDSLSHYQLIFVPGIRFDGELDENMIARLKEAIDSGTRVVVEKGSKLDIPGVMQWEDMTLLNYYLENYFATWYDDELEKVYEKSQITTDYLAEKLPELGIEPTARGPFKVGPNWRSRGDFNYFIMANFEDPEYNYSIKQIMASPVVMPLNVPAHRGKVAYDLLRQERVNLEEKDDELFFELEMARIEGGLLAFVPEAIENLVVNIERAKDNSAIRIEAHLVGESGNELEGVFPTDITIKDAAGDTVLDVYRVLGEDLYFEANLPAFPQAKEYTVAIRENISGRTAITRTPGPTLSGPTLQMIGDDAPLAPYPHEVEEFVEDLKEVTIVASERYDGYEQLAGRLAEALEERGLDVQVAKESSVYRFPGDPELADPYMDGFHSWRKGHEVIQPATVVDGPVIVMSGMSGSYLLDGLVTNGFITNVPAGGPEMPVRPSIQVAHRGLHWKHDTLCLIANDRSGMKKAIDRLLDGVRNRSEPPTLDYGQAEVVKGSGQTEIAPAVDFLSTNEFVRDIQFDDDGNSYVVTWGHGNNIYSFTPGGELRFTRHLPESHVQSLEVHGDRVLAFTAAGSRLYIMSSEGEPVSQMRLTLDPGRVVDEGYELSRVNFQYLPQERHIIQNMGEAMRIVDEEGNIVLEWEGKEYYDVDVADEELNRQTRDYVFSPDGRRLAQLESSYYYTGRGHKSAKVNDGHIVIRDLEGNLKHEYKNISNETGSFTPRVMWRENAPGPAVVYDGEIWQFDEKLELLHTRAYNPGMLRFGDGRRLVRDGFALRYMEGDAEVSRTEPFDIMPTMAAISPSGERVATLDENRRVFVFNIMSGERTAEFDVPEMGEVFRFHGESNLVIGSIRGNVFNYDLTGKLNWKVSLADFNDTLIDPPLYSKEFPDYTNKLWPETHAEPGGLDELVRMGRNRLRAKREMAHSGWQGEDVEFHDTGYKSEKSLKVGQDIVHQDVSKYLGNHVTWVLEFFYKAESDSSNPVLTAGLMVENDYPDSLARRMEVDGQWRFARLVVKSGAGCEFIRIGFSSSDGKTLVDGVKFRQIRFPSINYLHYEPFYEVEPRVLTNSLLLSEYDLFGEVRDEAPSKVMLPPLASGGKPMLDPQMLQNARLNDVDNLWYEEPQPPRLGRGALQLSVPLPEPQWVSTVALYFDAYDEENVTPHFDIIATDLEKERDVKVASVRNNRQVFRIVKFDPVKTPLITIDLVNSVRSNRTLTEIEVYGPLGGRDVTSGFIDPEGQNTYMGDFSRVDSRNKVFHDEYEVSTGRLGRHGDRKWQAPAGQVLVSNDKLYITRMMGFNEMSTLDAPFQPKTIERAGGLGYSPFVTKYGGLLLKSGNRGRLYCIDSDSSRELWSVKVGQRLRGTPVVIGKDVYVATDTAKLYRLDLANGNVLMEVDLTGSVHGSVATDGTRLFLISDDGYVQAIRAVDGEVVWKVPVAGYSDSTPAVEEDVVYVGDVSGMAKAISAESGDVVWSTDLGDEFARCPVVVPGGTSQSRRGDSPQGNQESGKPAKANRSEPEDGRGIVIYGCRGGDLVALRKENGEEVWSMETDSRFSYEPLVLGDSLLFFDGRDAKRVALDSGKVQELAVPEPFELPLGDPFASLSYYKGKIIIVPRPHTHEELRYNHPWHPRAGMMVILSPKTENEPEGQ